MVFQYRFQFLSRNSVRWDTVIVSLIPTHFIVVSIPQSEFCPLGRAYGAHLILFKISFNSSVGILSVGTPTSIFIFTSNTQVSIPQSEFCPLGRVNRLADDIYDGKVSIPQSEFCPLGPKYHIALLHFLQSFNSSVGILSVGTKVTVWNATDRARVSIPQSEFCPLGRK